MMQPQPEDFDVLADRIEAADTARQRWLTDIARAIVNGMPPETRGQPRSTPENIMNAMAELLRLLGVGSTRDEDEAAVIAFIKQMQEGSTQP